jgi:guanosine-3',5'-bis(diphosphate) 3'-pyrophosphohydrolase
MSPEFYKQQQLMLSVAFAVASDAHNNVLDKGGKPYIMHPIAIMGIVNSTDPLLNQIIMMHDVIEDSKKYTYESLRQLGFSEIVIDGVRRLTKNPGQTQQEYFNEVAGTERTIIAKIGDLTHNSHLDRLIDVTDKDIARVVKYCKMKHELSLLLK